MLTEELILEIANDYLKKLVGEEKIELAILHDLSIKKPYGIVFFYNTKKYYESRDDKDNTLVGNAPFLIEYEKGNIIDFGTNRSEEYYMGEYEAGRWPVK
ncbi:hypothetical protein [Chryseobacterium binzhouense]|uniref:hypothetical protein n=1 Tax=Chryseobacterium binzhouense TaxID=2593646 RepID=UPI00117EA79D|nr:hypothetical protein [Chryseobacterium binzhouense]